MTIRNNGVLPLEKISKINGEKEMDVYPLRKKFPKKTKKHSLMGFTLIELQMASLLMIVVLIATGVIFYFALASIRYMHDAFAVYSNATSAIKSLTDEVMISNCYGDDVDPGFLPLSNESFYGPLGYVHGQLEDGTTPAPLSGQAAFDSLPDMPAYQDNISFATDLYLRQAQQSDDWYGVANTSVAGDFPSHILVHFYLVDPTGTGELTMDKEGAQIVVARHVTDFSVSAIAYNCLAVRLTVTGTVPSPVAVTQPTVHEVTLGKMITLRCAPGVRPWAKP